MVAWGELGEEEELAALAATHEWQEEEEFYEPDPFADDYEALMEQEHGPYWNRSSYWYRSWDEDAHYL